MSEVLQHQQHGDDSLLRDAVAVIGMAGRFPGARNIAEFWKNLRDGVDSIRAYTPEELQRSGVTTDQLNDPNYVNAGAPLEHADCFDAAFFGYTPKEAELMDPQHRVFLECAYSALQDAGYDPENIGGPVGVFGGVARNTYFLQNAEVYRNMMNEGGLYEAMLGSEKDFPTTRVSYKLNLKGPSINVQSACSTSGVAIHLACQSLLGGECEMALAGGTRIRVPLHGGYIYVEGGIPSPDGHCRAFDAGANGCVFGSGVGFVVLKRLTDAISHRDNIHAIIAATAINNDGSSKIGFTAPSVEGQSSVIQEALAMADVNAETIDYVEAHGTGTTLGDPIEIKALTDAFRRSTDRKNYCAIGSLKTNIGHLDAGAGVAGMIKTVLAIKQKQIPPTLNFESPNPQIEFAQSPFYVNDKMSDWPVGAKPRRAGISSFGLGGTNFHAILEEAPTLDPSGPSRPWHLITLSAKSNEALEVATRDLSNHLADNPKLNLADVAYTLHVGRPDFDYRSCWVCQDVDHAIRELRKADGKQSITVPSGGAKSLVYMFPGQGAQHVNIGRDLFEDEPVFRAQIDECAESLLPLLDLDLRQLLYPKSGQEEKSTKTLTQTEYAQPALFVVELALARLWQSWGIKPQAMIGHSVGEFTAATLAGVFSVEEALRLLAVRGRLMQQQPTGSMLAVCLSEEEIQCHLKEGICLAACNAPSLCVVSGPSEQIKALDKKLSGKSIGTRPLHTSHAFHSSMMEPVLEPFLREIKQTCMRPPEIPFISSLTGTWITHEEATNSEYWAEQLRKPVRFSPGIRELQADTNRVLLEVGPGKTLYTLALKHRTKQAPLRAVASLKHVLEEKPDLTSVLGALGQLWMAGVEVSWSRIYENQKRYRVSLPSYPFERTRFWLQTKTSATDAERDTGPQVGATFQAKSQPVSRDPDTSAVELAGTAMQLADRKTLILDELKKILHELSGMDVAEIDERASFVEMGFDSLFLTQANFAIQKRFKVKITFRQLFVDAQTPAALADYIEQELPSDQFAPSDVSREDEKKSTHSETENRPGGAGLPQSSSQETETREASTASPTVYGRDLQNSGVPAYTSQTSPQQPEHVEARAGFGPYRPVKKTTTGDLSDGQKQFLGKFIKRYNRKTKTSKRLAQEHRGHMADPRTVSGFNLHWKECVYPIIAESSSGAYVWDVDGNKYVDVAMGFGVNMLGHAPPYVTRAVEDQLKHGYAIGPQTTLAGDVAELISEMTGTERVAFCNTGSEAVLAAIRIARTVTGRKKILTFSGDYHGIFDEVLGRSVGADGQRRNVPVAPGILPEMLENLIVLEYGDFKSIKVIEEEADDIAAVIVEPVRTRQPELQPREFLHALRDITTHKGIALVFDEMVTGFRVHPGGAQAWFNVTADIVAYGKVVAGGLPIGIVAGKAEYMDALDGGRWSFGDDSVPEAGVTWFAGTFVRHPLALAASAAALRHMKKVGSALQHELNSKTEHFVRELNGYFFSVRAPIRLQSFSSFFLITFEGSEEYSSLFYFYLRDKGIHITQNRAAFLSTEHSDQDLEFLVRAFKEAVSELMEASFLSKISAVVVPEDRAGAMTGKGISKVPLTEGQSEIWLAAMLGDELSCAYNYSNSLRLKGHLDVPRLRMALGTLVQRHDALRMIIDQNGETQETRSVSQLDIPLHDLTEHSSEEREDALAKLRHDEVTTPFDLVRGPLVRAQLIRLMPAEHLLFFTAHHVICDGYSSGILFKDLGEIYSALGEGRVPQLKEAESFRIYAIGQTQDPSSDEAEAYWIDRLRHPPPVLDLPPDRPRPAQKTFNADRVQRALDQELGHALSRMASDEGTTTFTLFYSAFTAFLERLTGQDDMVVAIVAAGQPRHGEVVGHLVNLLPVRVRVNRNQSFLDHLHATKRRVLDSFEHQSCTFGTVVKKMHLSRDPSRLPLVSVIFNMDPKARPLNFADLQVEVRYNPRRYENFDWFFNILPGENGFIIECTYNTDLFDESTIRRRLHEFEVFLAAILADADQLTGLIELVPDEERQLLDAWNSARQELPQVSSIHELIEAQVKRTPEAVAIIAEERHITYGELNRRSNQLANYLRHLAVGPEVLVGVNMRRSPDMIVAILGILKAGGAYVPLDPDYPQQRLDFMLEDSQALVVLTEQELVNSLRGRQVRAICLDSDWEEISEQSDLNPKSGITPSYLAYLIYTSGSTGKPKGVALEHRSVIAFVHWARDVFSHEELGGVLFSTSICFDLSVFEMFVPLSSGGAVVLADDALHLPTLATANKVTLINSVPSVMTELLRMSDLPKSVRTVNLAGEPLKTNLVERLYNQPSVEKVYDLFGPSEDTTYSTYALRSADGPYTIGKPVPNSQVHLLDAYGNPVPIGVPGEMYLGGAGLARGYFDRPDLTAEKFIANKFSSDADERLYRTGDLARWLPDGNLEFLGRIDNQVKIRGFRIELGEVETILGNHPAVQEQVVVAREDVTDDKRLVAYVVLETNVSATIDELKKHLRRDLPEHMVPQHIGLLDRLPLTPNGKVDRRALPEPGFTSSRLSTNANEETNSRSLIPDIEDTTKDLEGQAEFLASEYEIARVCDMPIVVEMLNALCRAHVCRYLVENDPDFRMGAVEKISDQRRAISLRPAYRKFHEYMLSILEADGVIRRECGQITVLQDPLPLSQTEEFAEQAVRTCPGFKGSIEMLSHCCGQYRESLSGEIPGVSVLFADGRRDFLDRLLREETVEHKDLRIYRTLLCQLIVELAKTRPLRILEIGGGGGMLTWELAPELQDLDVEYTFTDIGTSIVAEAQRKAKEKGLDFIRFHTLDITRDPVRQGFELQTYDVIIGLNVVHATPDIDDSLGQLVRLLVPGGVLGLVEYTQSPRWDDLIWGVTEGWWCFEDRYRRKGPLVDLATWEEALSRSGLTDVRAIPANDKRNDTDGGLIVGSVPMLDVTKTTVEQRMHATDGPRDTIELQLCKAWEALLRVKPVGIHDDFFDLGGHSLLAVRLMVQIEKTYGKRLPLATLIQERTVAGLADYLRNEHWKPRWDSLVPMRAGGKKPPLFLMHSHGGNVLEYDPLVKCMSDDQPVYALQARGLDGNFSRDTSIEEMAAYYVKEIRSLQPEGPYTLGGFCLGGILALEAAQQLSAAGDDVTQVFLIQCKLNGLTHDAFDVTTIRRTGYSMMSRIDVELNNLASQNVCEKLHYIWQRIRRTTDVVQARNAIAMTPILEKFGITRTHHSMAYILEALSIAHEQALRKYSAEEYEGKVVLLRAEKQRRGLKPDETLGWGSLLNGQLECVEVPGYQQNMLEEPNVRVLAERIEARLAGVQ